MHILELAILTNDLWQTTLFYTEIMGFTTLEKGPLSVIFSTGSTKLTFIQSDIEKPVYHFAFNIPNNKIEEALALIDKKAGALTAEGNNKIADFDDWNARSVYFRDNNGNILEFIARSDLDNQNNREFDTAQILCISEIGIAVDNVATESEMLIQKNKMAYFSKQPPQENFAALGDDNGLIILAKDLRSWFPTDIPARKYRTKIKFELDGKMNELEFHSIPESY